MQKRWNILKAAPAKVAALQAELGIHPILCEILVNRGVENFSQAKGFFIPRLEDLHSPWLMKDMEAAVGRILAAFEKQEKILIYGDYDADGTTAVACMVQFLRGCCRELLIDYYIPHRNKEGYGISVQGIDFAKENEFTLIISLDCGIRSAGLISYAKELGIDFIVCDHHLPDDQLPPAIAILDPKQADCPYPYKDLCGCGVGFKLITALAERLDLPVSVPHQYLDLVATAIAADIVPMDGENRILAYYGLKKINEDPNKGLKAMIRMGAPVRPLKMNTLVFMIAPRINAAGRMDDARKVVQLFTTPHDDEALAYAAILHTVNTERKTADLNITGEALALLEKDAGQAGRKSIVLYQEHWHKGVIGIVASRLTEKYSRPTVVLTRNGNVVSGSARSFSGFNLYEAIHACREHLVGYGGHPAAAGLTLLPDQVEAFSHKFEEIVAATIKPHSLVPELTIDATLTFDIIGPAFFQALDEMEPFGPGNAQPVFIARKVIDKGYSRIVKDQHIRFSVYQDGQMLTGIGYHLADKFNLLSTRLPVDLVFTLEENEWNGRRALQLKVIDLDLSSGE